MIFKPEPWSYVFAELKWSFHFNIYKFGPLRYLTSFNLTKIAKYIVMSSGSGRSERNIHQDYIARIRYSNALPPPPLPPKLLEIPNVGLASGQYTSTGFASRLAREQPLNIEADAELGMPIDLVGLPGVFDGDESGTWIFYNYWH